MAAKKPPCSAAPERRHTVRWHRSRKCLTADPETTWRWSEPSQATQMTRAEADAAAARMGGVVCIDGIPVENAGIALPARPKMPRFHSLAENPRVAELRQLVAAERWREAIRLALKLRDLGADKTTLERAWDGLTRPEFCREIRRDPNALAEAGIAILKRRFSGTSGI